MKEEMEEGKIDEDGHYIPNKKEKDEIRDSWLDNIDWIKVNSQSAQDAQTKDDDQSYLTEITPFDHISAYKEVLELLLPGETVLKALKRFGGQKTLTASQRWKNKKEGKGAESTTSSSSDKEKLTKLTGLADSILNKMANMDVYDETYESIKFKIQQAEAASAAEPEQDMFGEVFVAKSVSKSNGQDATEPLAKKVRFDEEGKFTEAQETATKDEVQWEFKWENAENAEVHGPHSTLEMLNWVNEGYFEAGVWVRRVGQQGDFHSSRRIDFDLYL